MRIDESNFETIQKASEITLTDYNIYWKDAENVDGYIDTDDLVTIIQDLICEIEHKEEEIEDLKNQEKESEYDPYDLYMEHKEGIL